MLCSPPFGLCVQTALHIMKALSPLPGQIEPALSLPGTCGAAWVMLDMDVNKYLIHGALLSHLGEQIALTESDFTQESFQVR